MKTYEKYIGEVKKDNDIMYWWNNISAKDKLMFSKEAGLTKPTYDMWKDLNQTDKAKLDLYHKKFMKRMGWKK